MKEFLLNYTNDDNYFQKEQSFKYRIPSMLKEYTLIYKRDGISLDVEYFKDLISFSKKHVGSSLLCLNVFSDRFNNIEIRQNGEIFIKNNTLRNTYTLSIINLKIYNKANIYDYIFVSLPIFEHLDSFKYDFAEYNTLYTKFIDNLYLKKLHHNTSSVYEYNSLGKTVGGLHIYYNHLLRPGTNTGFYYNNDIIRKLEKDYGLNVFNSVASKSSKALFDLPNVSAAGSINYTDIYDNKMFANNYLYNHTFYFKERLASTSYKSITKLFSNDLLKPFSYIKVNHFENILLKNKNDLNANIFENILIKDEKIKNIYEKSILNINKSKFNRFNINETINAKTNGIFSIIGTADNFIASWKDVYGQFFIKELLFSNREVHRLYRFNSFLPVTRNMLLLKNINTGKQVYRKIYNVFIAQNQRAFNIKDRKIKLYNNNLYVSRKNKTGKDYSLFSWADKLFGNAFSFDSSENISHYLKKFNIIDHNFFELYKEGHEIMQNKQFSSDVIRQLTPIMLDETKNSAILSVNKLKNPTFTRDFVDFAFKGYKNSDILQTSSVLLGKLAIQTFSASENAPICDKLSKDTRFSDYIGESVIKSIISIRYYNTDEFIAKNYIISNDFSNVFIYKIPKNSYDASFCAIDKTRKDTFENDFSTIIKDSRSVVDISNIEWFLMYRPIFIDLNQHFISKSPNYTNKMIQLENDVHKTSNIINIDDNKFLSDVSKITSINDIDKLIRSNVTARLYNNYFLNKRVGIDFIPNLEGLIRTIKELSEFKNDNSNWVWVYEEDEGFDDPFKIDELLLPENDTRYEDFENIIFNRETSKPRNPVKIIDDNTFIAKLPNHYPIKDDKGENAYKDVALEYLDVRTSIMRQVFIGYYKLWQDHVFDFSRMTIPQSSKKILDYLYTWILVKFPEEDIPEALRTFRLIRWYLERSSIELSEYQITYEPDDLTSGKMDTTELPIENEMKNMYVDTNIHTIRNNQDKLRQEAYTTFFIENDKETTISFFINTFTPVVIELNGEVIDNITLPTQGKMVYNIPYTGDVNEFCIKKKNIDNNDVYFYISNVIISGIGKNGKLNIEFNPKLDGNRVLNHVSQKVIAYMNLYYDNEPLMKELIDGNAHLSDVYDHLLEYWDIHHEDKWKGKRLTIKRT